ncbi:hypothetical protein H632_c4464p0, partial [Helicosporidium sp. ATCC 50920]
GHSLRQQHPRRRRGRRVSGDRAMGACVGGGRADACGRLPRAPGGLVRRGLPARARHGRKGAKAPRLRPADQATVARPSQGRARLQLPDGPRAHHHGHGHRRAAGAAQGHGASLPAASRAWERGEGDEEGGAAEKGRQRLEERALQSGRFAGARSRGALLPGALQPRLASAPGLVPSVLRRRVPRTSSGSPGGGRGAALGPLPRGALAAAGAVQRLRGEGPAGPGAGRLRGDAKPARSHRQLPRPPRPRVQRPAARAAAHGGARVPGALLRADRL